ncbi:membrane-associated guanylate kinase, WW and PDZ domain-containing protein 3 isoform X2 [Ciona intestinalis]
MSSGKKHKHWSDRVHESVVSRNKTGQLNLVIKGGAEEIRFPFFGPVKQEKVIYHSGKIHDGEILLEVNDQAVVGLTLYDLNNLIKQARDPVRFKTVKEGQTLTKDLKLYLSQRFNKGTVDHKLQAAIRDNLYLRTLPCTTRSLREGEQDGVDYTFLSEEQFHELEKSGALLESGVYEGNYYGTPKPPPVPLSPPIVRRSNSANDLPGMHPSSDGKRRRNRSNIEQQSSSSASTPRRNHVFPPNNKDGDKKTLSVTTKESSSPNGDLTPAESPKKETLIPHDQQNSDKILGPLPEGWEMGQTENGDCYFIDHIGKKTSWVDPRLEKMNRKSLLDCEDDELPYGWEKVEDAQFGLYFVDHIDKKTQFENPVIQAKREAGKSMEHPDLPSPPQSDNEEQNGSELDPRKNTNSDDSFQDNMSSQENYVFTRDPSKLKGVSHLVPIEKSRRGFGFTIVGGDDPEEFLQIKSVVSDGAAAKSGNIEQGDVIVKVNDTCVLGWTHPDVVKLFQAIPVGQIVTLQLCRGYPLIIDSDDPSTNLLTTYAIRPEDKPTEEFNRQLRLLNTQLDDGSEVMGDMNGETLMSSPSKSMPNIADHPNTYYPNYGQHNIGMLPQSTGYPTRAGSMGALPAPLVMQVIIQKGEQGFGFTISDSPQGQRVKQVLEAQRCHELMEGDILLEINGTTVQNMPHNNVVHILKDCPSNAAAIFVIQRGPLSTPMYDPEALMSYQPGFANGISHHPHAFQNHNQAIRARMKRSTTEPGLGSENGSVVSAPPSSSLGPPTSHHPVNALLSEYRTKHHPANMRHDNYGIPMTYQPYGGQSLYHDPYVVTPQTDNYIYLTVVLRREETGFGFRILGGNFQDESVTIGQIVKSGAADKEGTLRTGDELLTVDGKKVTRIGHNQVIALMGNAARNAVVQLGIRRKETSTAAINRPHSRGPVMNPRSSSRPSSRGPPNPPLNEGQPFDIIIHRREHEGFGFVIISSVKTSITGFQAPHKIGRIIDGSPAARCGHLRVGDRILAVNNVDITHLHHGQIVNLIKDSGFSIALHVLPIEADLDNSNRGSQSDSECFYVELPRSNKGFGFGIRGGKEYNLPLYVLRVAKDGPAAESGQIRVGDILMEINGKSTIDIPHSQAINLIKQGGLVVKLLLKHGDGNVPELGTPGANPSGSMQSLSSSALSGSDAANRAAQLMHFCHPEKVERPPPSSHPSSKGKPPPTLPKPQTHNNSVRQLRRRANSSGQVLPPDPNQPQSTQLRRSMTPNPAKSPREPIPISPNSDVAAPNPQPELQKAANFHPEHFSNTKSPEPVETNHGPPSSNGLTSPTNSKSSEKLSSPDKSTDTETTSPTSSTPTEENKKKSKKSSKSNKKSSKVGLWLSPKKKQK